MKHVNDRKIIIIFVITFFILVIGHIYYSYIIMQQEQEKFALAESKILNSFISIHREHYQVMKQESSELMPSYSLYSISKKFSQKNDYDIKVKTTSLKSESIENKADLEELKAIKYFQKNLDKGEFFEFVDDPDEPYYQYAYTLGADDLGNVENIISIKVPQKHTYEYVREKFFEDTLFKLMTLIFILVSSVFVLFKRAKDIKILNKATREANSANRAKSEFLANMSHEIRTPLNAILGFVEVLVEDETDKKKLKYLNTIDNSSHSLLGVINDILDFSKIESGKLKIDKKEFNPTQVFESTSALFCAKSEEKKLHFNTYIDENLPLTIISDPLRIKQVLSNLLSNAIKFSKEDDEVELIINYIKETNKIRFSVKDSGIGISKEYKTKLFKPFTQEHSSTTREHGGTGLGLTISSQLVSMLGGELKVESELGRGSEFYFELAVENVCQINLNTVSLFDENYVKGLKISTVFSKAYGSKKETLKQYLKALGANSIDDFEELSVEKLKNSDLLILDSFIFDAKITQEILDNDIVVIVIEAGLSNSLIIELKGKVAELECPVTISDLHDVIMEHFATETISLEKEIKEIPSTTFEDKKILLVEDNSANQMFMKVILDKLKIEFDIAHD